MTKKKKQWTSWLNSLREEAGFGPLKILRDADGRLHCDDGPAYVSPTAVQWWNQGRLHGVSTDIYGSVCYYFKGVMVPKKYITNPEELSLKDILNHRNTEVRRVGIELFGLQRILESGKARIIDEEENGQQLLAIRIGKDASGVVLPDSTYVKVFNSTPEIDGTHKVYFLSVPPEMETVRQAVAWTFYATEDTYHPQIEA